MLRWYLFSALLILTGLALGTVPDPRCWAWGVIIFLVGIIMFFGTVIYHSIKKNIP